MANEVIEEYGEFVDLITRLPGEMVRGKWVEGAPTTIQIFAAILPLALSEMATDVAAAGFETKDSIAIYTEHEIKEAEEKTKQNRDIILWHGNRYVVKMAVPRYQIDELSHWKAVAVLEGS